MPTSRSTDYLLVALDALHCPPDELAYALGIELRALWRIQERWSRVPESTRRRLTAFLRDRGTLLLRTAAQLDRRRSSGTDRSRTYTAHTTTLPRFPRPTNTRPILEITHS